MQSSPFSDPVPHRRKMPSVVDKDITQAVRDTVTVEGRSRLGRSQTQSAASSSSLLIPGSHRLINRNPALPPKTSPSGKRSQSQDSAQLITEKKSSGKSRPKKGSQHADVIDRLDFTGVGPSAFVFVPSFLFLIFIRRISVSS